MYVEEITVDGFKSYAQRVNVGKFDPHFNAITGLNGSGKSNILDSICFVLGITNLNQVRASSLQELVYKGGQAGVTKATVSIVFNNDDKANSPLGYESHDKITVTRQVVIGGRNKYLINGKVAETSRVQNLFHSVQLNVNNPHFLIMQGRITKVLNMKPLEILGMLEEAAGTRMYESKKAAALKTLDRKDIKVSEIDKVLQEEILPALEKFKHERAAYLEWAEMGKSIDGMRRFLVAWRYVLLVEELSGGGEAGAVRAALEDCRLAVREAESDLSDVDNDLRRLEDERNAKLGPEVQAQRAQLDAHQNELVKLVSAWEAERASLQDEEKASANLDAQWAGLDPTALTARVAAEEAKLETAVAAVVAAEAAIQAAEREHAGALAGDGRDESNRSMAERLSDAKNAQTSAQAAKKTAAAAAKATQSELTAAEKDLKKQDAEVKKMEAAKRKAEKAVEAARVALEKYTADRTDDDRMETDGEASPEVKLANVEAARAQLRGVEARLAELEPRVRASRFMYDAASVAKAVGKGPFDAKMVRGTVAELAYVPNAQHVTALEVIGGGRLRHVVVDSSDVAEAILKHGRTRTRTTFLPLNRLSVPQPLSAEKLRRAKEIVGDKATPALSLIEYDPSVARAMELVFGNVFVCTDERAAKALAFARDVGVRCVTLQGDDFNPSGILSGGSRHGGPQLLANVRALREAGKVQADAEAHLRQVEQAWAELEARGARKAELVEDLEAKEHEMALLVEKVACSEVGAALARVETLRATLAQEQSAVAAAEKAHAAAGEEAQQLAHDLKNWKSIQQTRIAEAAAKREEAKATLATAKDARNLAETAAAEARGEEGAAAGERDALASRRADAEVAVAALRQRAVEAEAAVASQRARVEAADAERKALAKALKEADQDMRRLGKAKDRATKQLQQRRLEEQDAVRRLEVAEAGLAASKKECARLTKENPWLAAEKHTFGVVDGPYDFTNRDFAKDVQELEEAEARYAKLSKGVNRKVMSHFDNAQAEYHALAEKKRIVQRDKDKIETVITELDHKKREALAATWAKVNGDFGSIFTTLLPGTSAKLEPPEEAEGDVMMGLEVKVAFGGVWKQSLTELSGGQRSLLALSLILALLLFKPAPIYILDEVDAALDLSHTQNIGRMIKTHFPYSQFIVVSLKEGMFNNANVLFRTKFVEGVSTVTRIVPERARLADGPTGGPPAAGKGRGKKAALGEATNQP